MDNRGPGAVVTTTRRVIWPRRGVTELEEANVQEKGVWWAVSVYARLGENYPGYDWGRTGN